MNEFGQVTPTLNHFSNKETKFVGIFPFRNSPKNMKYKEIVTMDLK